MDRIERNVIIARSGCYDYGKEELGNLNLEKSSIPDKYQSRDFFTVYTPSTVLVAAKDLFTKLPIVIEHPVKHGMVVTPQNYGELAKGWTGDSVDVVQVGNEVGLESTANLLGLDALIYYECDVRDVSPGYWASYRWEDGTSPDGQDYQIVKYEINKVNHLAFTQKGRGGPEISMDSALMLNYDKITMDSIWETEMTKDAEFRESDHPRADDGKFGSGGGPIKSVKLDDPKKWDSLKDSIESSYKSAKSSGGMGIDDVLRDKEGVIPGRHTSVDTLYFKNRKSFDDLYNSFNPTRESIRKEYGDTVTLYRADPISPKNPEGGKPTLYMGVESTAKKFGSETRTVKSYEIPVDDIVFSTISRGSFSDHVEFIVMNPDYKSNPTADSALPTFPEMIDDIVTNRTEYDDDEIKTGVDAVLSLVLSMPDCPEKLTLTRVLQDFYDVKRFTGDSSIKEAAKTVTELYEELDKKIMEDSMGLFTKKPTTDAVPEPPKGDAAPVADAPAPATDEAPLDVPGEPDAATSGGPGVAPVGPEAADPAAAPVAHVAQVAMEVSQMPDDVSALSDDELRAFLNGVVKFLKSIAPGEAMEPEHQEAPVTDSVTPEGEGIPPMGDSEMEDEKKPTTDSVIFGMPLGDNSKPNKSFVEFNKELFGKKGAK